MDSPWPNEPHNITSPSIPFVKEHSGKLTHRLLDEAEKEGYLTPTDGLLLEVAVRCSYQKPGEFQHKRDAWHYDSAEKGWIYTLGPCPTEIREEDGRVWVVEPGSFVPYHKKEHRCPPQDKAGWRYFMRILWCSQRGKSVLYPTSSSPPIILFL